MKARMTRLLSLLLLASLALGDFAFAEENIEATPVDRAVEEVDWTLSDAGFEVWTETGGVSAAEIEEAEDQPDVEATIAPDPTEAPEVVAEPEVTRAPEPTPFPMQDELPKPDDKSQLGPVHFREGLKPIAISLKKASAKKNVFMGLSYVVRIRNEEVKRFASKDETVVTVDEVGALTLLKPGEATVVVKTKSGKTFRLALTVKEAPAPTGLSVAATRRKLVLRWDKVKRATGYMVQVSAKGKKWDNFRAVSADTLKLNVAAGITGPAWLRVVTILGDHFGGASEAVRVLAPVTDAKVIQEEQYYFGPTDRLNVTWSPSVGAYGYEVWRAALPSKDYKLIGTTRRTWFADVLAPTQLYSYKVRPVWGGLELPFCKPVNLWTGLEKNQLPPEEMTSDTGIILVVNKLAQVVTAYIRDANGRYTLPLRHMVCSTGRNYDRTRNGIYTIQGHKGEWYTYPGPSGDTIRWPSVYRGGYYFHSPLYNRNHTIRGYTVNRLGNRASAGCVRLKSNDAEWVYKNCPNGTTVWICDGGPRDSLKSAILPKDVVVQGF